MLKASLISVNNQATQLNLCVGAFSGKPVAVDSGYDKDGDDKDGDDKDGATTVVSSSVLVIAILTLTLFNN